MQLEEIQMIEEVLMMNISKAYIAGEKEFRKIDRKWHKELFHSRHSKYHDDFYFFPLFF